jgi:hypothetical protein
MKNVNLWKLAADGADELREGVSERGRDCARPGPIIPQRSPALRFQWVLVLQRQIVILRTAATTNLWF